MLYVTYLRVSTQKQGESGLGVDAQRTAVTKFTADGSVLAEFVEVESGKKAARPQLKAALALCRQRGATLVVAKLDRLARNVLFTATLMEAGVDFICCDMPSATRLTIHLLAAIAEDEARRISARTKAALSELKAKGAQLGSARPGHWDGREHRRGWNGIPAARKLAMKREKLNLSYAESLPVIRVLKERAATYLEIASALNAQGIKTPRGHIFTASAVCEVIQRLEAVA